MLIKRTKGERQAYMEGYEAGKKAGRKNGELIEKEDALAVFGDVHPMDYNANAYRKQIEELQGKSLTEIAEEMLEDIKAEICDTRCKWPEKWDKSQGELCESEHCTNCPLNKL